MLILRGGWQGLTSLVKSQSTSRKLVQSLTVRSLFTTAARKASAQNAHHPAAHHDPQEHWYEFPPHIEVKRHSHLKLPWYIGRPPTASYRAPCTQNVTPYNRFMAYFLHLFMWWWISWNWIFEPGHVTGEFFWPDRHSFSNAELGVPDLDV